MSGYVFADLDELDDIIAEWRAIQDRIESRGYRLSQAHGLITPPAEDAMSRLHAGYTQASLRKAADHNESMRVYTQAYIDKLKAARARYAVTDTGAAAAFRRNGEG